MIMSHARLGAYAQGHGDNQGSEVICKGTLRVFVAQKKGFLLVCLMLINVYVSTLHAFIESHCFFLLQGQCSAV